jgi:hypothetical protein
MEVGDVDASKAKDSRNAVENILGLPEDQNFIFDIFELLTRPQKELFDAIDTTEKGGDAGLAALSNFKDYTETNFKDILKNAGMEDSEGLHLTDDPGFF